MEVGRAVVLRYIEPEMIFKVVANTDIRKTNDNIDAIAEFIKCNDSTLKYVLLMNDYDSPYARQPEEMRKESVLIALGYLKEGTVTSFFSRNRENIDKAERVFRKMQYDSDFEALISMKIQVDQYNDLLRNPDKTEKEMVIAQKAFEKMNDYIDSIKKLEEKVGWREDYHSEKQEDNKSTLERYLDDKDKQLKEEE